MKSCEIKIGNFVNIIREDVRKFSLIFYMILTPTLVKLDMLFPYSLENCTFYISFALHVDQILPFCQYLKKKHCPCLRYMICNKMCVLFCFCFSLIWQNLFKDPEDNA